MEITEVRVKLVNGKNDKLRAFCSITIDNDFVIRDLKVIDGSKGPFVAMPSRKLTERCPKCGGKNHYRAKFCNDCGGRVGGGRSSRGDDDCGETRAKLHVEIAHPINSRCREVVQREVLDRYEEEYQRSQLPGYQAASLRGDDEYEDYFQDDASRSRERDDWSAEQPAKAGAASSPTGSSQAKPALDEPGLGADRKKNTSNGGEYGDDSGRSPTDRQAMEQRPSSPPRSDPSPAPDHRQATEPKTSAGSGKGMPGGDIAQPKGPFKDSGGEDSELEDNFGVGIFT